MAWLIRIVRVRPNGTEQNLRELSFADITEEQLARADIFADAEQRKASGLHIRVYTTPNEDGVITREDCVWDSEINL